MEQEQKQSNGVSGGRGAALDPRSTQRGGPRPARFLSLISWVPRGVDGLNLLIMKCSRELLKKL